MRGVGAADESDDVMVGTASCRRAVLVTMDVADALLCVMTVVDVVSCCVAALSIAAVDACSASLE